MIRQLGEEEEQKRRMGEVKTRAQEEELVEVEEEGASRRFLPS